MSNGIAYENEDEREAFFARIAGSGLDRERVMSITGCKGTREQCAEFLGRWKSKGVDGVVFYFHDIASFGDGHSQAEIFKRDVLPHV
jgi:hypothetical protein